MPTPTELKKQNSGLRATNRNMRSILKSRPVATLTETGGVAGGCYLAGYKTGGMTLAEEKPNGGMVNKVLSSIPVSAPFFTSAVAADFFGLTDHWAASAASGFAKGMGFGDVTLAGFKARVNG